MRDMADFVASVLVREGCWVIEPTNIHNDSYIHNMLSKLRTIPARIWSPPGQSRYRFAERGQEGGTWFMVWMPEQK